MQQIADFDGSDRPDIFLVEIGLNQPGPPSHSIHLSEPGERAMIDREVPTHEVVVVEVTKTGCSEIGNKSYAPDLSVGIW